MHAVSSDPEDHATGSLVVTNLEVGFGGNIAVAGVTFRVDAGEIVALIGPNGAGKTTIVDAITGLVDSTGSVVHDGRRLDRLSTYRRARLGVVRTFQTLDLFDDLTVRQNVELETRERHWWRWLPALFTPPEPVAAVEHALDLVGLSADADRLPDELPLGRRRLVDLARAMARDPRVLLLDEPTSGLGREDADMVGATVQAIADRGPGVLLIEHDVDLVFRVADRVIALDFGAVIAAGTPDEVRRNERVAATYLGSRAGTSARPSTTRRPAPDRPVRLSLRDVSAGYDATDVVRGMNLDVRSGELAALVGPNGAGKSTLLRRIVGLVEGSRGSILLDGEPIDTMPPHRRAKAGIALVPEGRALFRQLSVRQNLRLGDGSRTDDLDRILTVFPALEGLLDRKAGLLSGGEQQMLAIGRALAAEPRVLLVDEMSQGLAPTIVDELFRSLQQLADEKDLAVLVVEQYVEQALASVHQVHVMIRGEIERRGVPFTDGLSTADILAVYLGDGPASVL
jgi:ABC-type branched-subunit amino acid transport system ATPase component